MAGTRTVRGSWPGSIAKLSRPRTDAVAGYDLTFSPVKSVSTLWAVADPPIAAAIERAHQAAVADALQVHRGARLVHPDRRERGPAGGRPRAGGGGVHPPGQPGRRPGSAHPCRGGEQGPNPRRALAVHRRPGAVQGHRHRLGDLQHRPGNPPPRHPRRPVRRTPEPGSAEAAGAGDRRRRPPTQPALVDPAGAHRGPAGRARHRVPAPPRPAAHPGRSPAAGAAGHAGDPRPETRTPQPGRATRHLACPSRRGSRRRRPGPGRWSTGRTGTDRSAASRSIELWIARAAERVLAAVEERRADLAGLARPRRGATPGPGRRGDRRPGRGSWSTGSSTRSSTAGRCPWPDPPTGSPNPPLLRRADGASVYTVAGADLYTSTRGPGRRTTPPPRRRPHDGRTSRPGGGRCGVVGDGRQRHRVERRPGRLGASDGHLRRPAAAGHRARRRRQDHRPARPGRRLDSGWR